MKSAAVFIVALLVAIGVMQLIKSTEYRRYTWVYVAILLMGLAVYNRVGLTAALVDLQNKLKGGQ